MSENPEHRHAPLRASEACSCGGGCGQPTDLAAARARLAQGGAPELWRSLEELAASPAFAETVEREFPRFASEWQDTADGVNRRRFLQLAGASLALGGLGACTRQPLETIVPYVKQPEEIVPGRPLFFATSLVLGGYAQAVLVESHEGRPTKIEGNPEHPASLGASDVFAQAAILGLYDPDRSQVTTELGSIRTWTGFLTAIERPLAAQRGLGGAGLRLLTGAVTSPSLAGQIGKLLQQMPRARWHQWEPAGAEAARAASELAFGRRLETRYDLRRADVVVALDSDFLTSGPGAVRYARDFADRRRLLDGERAMNRLYAVEATPTATGTQADHRLALPPREIAAFALALAGHLGVAPAPAGEAPRESDWSAFAAAAARDLQAHRGTGLILAGDQAPAAVHVLVHAMNAALGNSGATVVHSESVAAPAPASLAELARDLAAGQVDVLVVLGANPVYDAPADLDFTAALARVPLRIHLGLYADETAEYCHWHLNQAHALESWGDARAYDGTVSFQQPLVEPLYGGKTPLELVAALHGDGAATAHDLLRSHWQEATSTSGPDFEGFWRRAIHDGFLAESALPAVAAAPSAAAVEGAARELAAAGDAESSPRTLELVFRPDPAVFDGSFANNAWLQELPRPITKLVWDNALLLAPATAERLGLRQEELVEVRAAGRALRAPVWVLPGHAPDCATLHLGYGRRRAGRVGDGVGVNAAALRAAGAPWSLAGVELEPTGGRHLLVSTQMHQNIPLESEQAERRHLVRAATLADYVARPDFVRELEHHAGEDVGMYPRWEYPGRAWGMAVDLNACTGCNACVVACQAENNIPVVGKEQVGKGREMHWIRVDRYFGGDLEAPAIHNQPVMCMHCEQAPCEVVCPVAATTHSAEGLNDMVYNRCVGTRYCANNCPYKVRRFNFFNWNKRQPNDAAEHEVLTLLRNPDVTVRFRGVMEKCTYCVQRINGARVAAERSGRAIADGEIQTACQQACPSQAIVFGDQNDAGSRVARWKAEPRGYGLLTELATRPRTTYLARVRNPNPELEAAAPGAPAHAAEGA
jgi:molybdopterin-containing oxidoreductase family iron-sulfur binding subunit